MRTTNPRRIRYVAGIDVSKARLEVCLLPESESFFVANDQQGIDELAGRLQEARPELVVLEATGGYERPVAALASPP